MNSENLSWYRYHKDSRPIDTINKIRSILYKELDILPFEEDMSVQNNAFYSVRITADMGYTVGSNGKGITREFALASGYSEFIERLQNLTLLSKRFGLMKNLTLKRPNCKEMKLEDVVAENPLFFAHIFKEKAVDLTIFPKTCNCIPYYNVNRGKVCYLPEFLFSFTTSNGMCAGNTPEEAIAQGIGEIFERYAIRYIYENDLMVPTIPLSDLESLSLYGKIMSLERSGYKVIVKDCTLGGKIPVIAVVIFKQDYSKCIVNFGSDPSFEVALMRCITEAFQGFETKVEGKMYTYSLTNDQAEILTKKGIDDYQISCYLTKFFYSSGQPKHKDAFIEKYNSSENALHFLKQKVFEQGAELYIHDASFLGFPTYHIYIPGFSEFYDLDNYHANHAFVPAIKTLLSLPTATNEEIAECIRLIEQYREGAFQKFAYTPDYGQFLKDNTYVVSDSDFNMPLDFVMFLMCVKVGDYKKALHYIDEYLKALNQLNVKLANITFYIAVMHYLKLNIDGGKTEDEIKFDLENLFSPEITAKVFNTFANPESVMDTFGFPSCGDCKTCKIEPNCYYDRWLDISTRLQEKIKNNVIDQMSLKVYF